MKERNISTVAILTSRFNNLSSNAPYFMDRKTTEFYLRDNGFRGDFTSLIPIMIAEGLLFREEGNYIFPAEGVNLDKMRLVLKKYRERNHAKYMRQIKRQCNAAKEFLEKHGYMVIEDDYLVNSASTCVAFDGDIDLYPDVMLEEL